MAGEQWATVAGNGGGSPSLRGWDSIESILHSKEAGILYVLAKWRACSWWCHERHWSVEGNLRAQTAAPLSSSSVQNVIRMAGSSARICMDSSMRESMPPASISRHQSCFFLPSLAS